MRSVRRSVTSLFAVAMLVSMVLVAAPAQATFAGHDGLIAFVRAGNIYTATAAGGSVKQITTGGGLSAPRWSPDGKRLAYKGRAGAVVVRTMATGRTVTIASSRVAAGTGGPTWSPDGRQVAWLQATNSVCGEPGIYSAPSTGGATQLVLDPQVEEWDFCADPLNLQLGSWSVDGTSILMSMCYGGGDGSICSVEQVDVAQAKSRQHSITDLFSSYCDPADTACIYPKMGAGNYSPTTGGIVFSGRGSALPASSTTVERIYAVDRTGGSVHAVSTATSGYNPVWSPSGSKVVFTQQAASGTNLMVTGTSATSRATVLITNASQADWQPVA